MDAPRPRRWLAGDDVAAETATLQTATLQMVSQEQGREFSRVSVRSTPTVSRSPLQQTRAVREEAACRRMLCRVSRSWTAGVGVSTGRSCPALLPLWGELYMMSSCLPSSAATSPACCCPLLAPPRSQPFIAPPPPSHDASCQQPAALPCAYR